MECNALTGVGVHTGDAACVWSACGFDVVRSALRCVLAWLDPYCARTAAEMAVLIVLIEGLICTCGHRCGCVAAAVSVGAPTSPAT